MTDSGQCQKEATRDVRVAIEGKGWRFFFCDACVKEGMDIMRAYVDRLAQDPRPVESDPFSCYPDSVQDALARVKKRIDNL